jgi:hypothetical protein
VILTAPLIGGLFVYRQLGRRGARPAAGKAREALPRPTGPRRTLPRPTPNVVEEAG